MADSADLVVLGAWFGTGNKGNLRIPKLYYGVYRAYRNKNLNIMIYTWYRIQTGGMMSIFLMGCYNKAKQVWCTVTKVHGGHDDKTLERLQVKNIFLFYI